MWPIVISYRRNDSQDKTRSLAQSLISEFGEDKVFIDLDHIKPTSDYDQTIEQALQGCDILIAVVGPKWSGRGTSKSSIDREADWVRREIETAVGRGIDILPIFVDGGTMLDETELPPLLRKFAVKQGLQFDTGASFRNHLKDIVATVKTSLEKTSKRREQEVDAKAKEDVDRRAAEHAATQEKEAEQQRAAQIAAAQEAARIKEAEQNPVNDAPLRRPVAAPSPKVERSAAPGAAANASPNANSSATASRGPWRTEPDREPRWMRAQSQPARAPRVPISPEATSGGYRPEPAPRHARNRPQDGPYSRDYENDYDPQYDDDAYLSGGDDDIYDDVYRPRRGIGFWIVAGVIVLSLVSVAFLGVFAYRTIFNSPRSPAAVKSSVFVPYYLSETPRIILPFARSSMLHELG